MKEVTCPHCEQVFEMDAAGYADIAKQIKDSEFSKELESRLKDAEKIHIKELELAEIKVAEEMNKQFSDKEMEIEKLKSELKAEREKAALESELAIKKATEPLQKSVDQLQAKVDSAANEKHYWKKLLEINLKPK